jgi:hypothetical protein
MIVGTSRKKNAGINIDDYLAANPFYNYQLIGYECDKPIKVEMLAPTNL